MRYAFLLLVLIYQTSSGQNILEIEADKDHFHIDETNKLILFQTNLTPYRSIPDTLSVQLMVDDDRYELVGKQSGLSSANSYQVHKGNTYYRLFFTQLPVISIRSDSTIIDASKVPAEFKYVDNTQVLTSSIGIELRGGSSLSFPKKTYDLELRKSKSSDKSRDEKFGDLREDDDWILDGLYNEPLRMRSFMAHKLWLAIHRPAYLHKEPEARAGANVMWVEVFFQDTYQGVYLLSEQVDRKLLELKEFKDGEIQGELFKGAEWGDAVLFESVPPINTKSQYWDGYEIKYPGQKDTVNWENLYRLVDFVVNANSLTFSKRISNQFDLLNAVDYFIFFNAIRAFDNRGKNLYVARYSKEAPYFYIPWDLDATWGLHWSGRTKNVTGDILSNGFYQRLLNDSTQQFSALLTQRWYELRGSVLSNKAIASLIDETHSTLLDNNIYEREHLAWKEYTYDTTSISYLKSWTERRFAYLDEYFYDPVLSTDELESKEQPMLYPNPANGSFKIDLPHYHPVLYQLINAYGVVVRSGMIKPKNPIISVAGLPAGHYIFRAEDIIERVLIAH